MKKTARNEGHIKEDMFTKGIKKMLSAYKKAKFSLCLTN
jgi:hypothetical protein